MALFLVRLSAEYDRSDATKHYVFANSTTEALMKARLELRDAACQGDEIAVAGPFHIDDSRMWTAFSPF